MDASVHKEQQAILRALREFEDDLWPAFKRRGFGTMGEAFTAYLLMQLVSAKGAELDVLTDVPLSFKVARPRSAAEDFERTLAAGPVRG